MQRTKKRVLTILAFSLILLLSSIIISAYTSSNAQYTRPNSFDYLRSLDAFPRFDESQCEAGQDFILQIVPASCTPTVVRSDLLEEQNVPVFCPIMATKINPLIDVNAIDRISFKKEFPKDVSAVGFHPARAALSQGRELINSPIDTNIGYAVIVLKQNPIESSMPESVSGTLKATLTYDIKNAFGLGKANFISGELDDNEWKQQANKYSFWQGRGYVRVESVGDDDASISIYSGPEEIDRANSTSRATLPAIAIVVTKPTDTTATIRYANEYTFVGRDPLIPGALYYVSDTEPGKIFTPSEIETMPPFLQQVGRAKSEEILVLMIGAPFSFQSQ